MDTLTRICCYCPDHEARTTDAIARGEDVTHGICEPCRDRLLVEWGLTDDAVCDASGRPIAPAQGNAIAARPAGPWDQNRSAE